MIVHDCIQGSDDWIALRLGIPTASEMKNIITPAKGEFAAAHKKYMARLIAERLTGGPADIKPQFGSNIDIQRGHEMEPRIRSFYQFHTGANLKTVGFITTDDGRFGCSPDALILDGDGKPIGGLEVKAPSLETHLLWLEDGVLPDEHKVQVHGCLAVTGLPKWEFLAYNANLPDSPLIVTVTPDAFTEKLIAALERFNALYAEKWAKLKPLG